MRHLLLLVCVTAGYAQTGPANLGFEQGELGGVPTGWFVPGMLLQEGARAKLLESGCRTGRCVQITGPERPQEGMFGNLMQNVPADGYRLRRIRLRAAIRVQGPQTRAQMWLRLDRADRSVVFLENSTR